MSEQPVCPNCGDPMQLLETGLTKRPGQPDYVDLKYVCTNPNCPSKDTDMAKAVGPDGTQ